MTKLTGKNFWIIYTTLNISLMLIFASLAFFDYSLILGFLVGMISFLLFLLLIKLALKMVKNSIETQEKKQYKIKLYTAFLIFLLLLFLNLGLLSLFIWVNSYYHHNYNNETNIAFFPFNVITITSPYLLLSIFSIIWGIYLLIKTKRKEDNG
ncbi:hypothetical protein [Metamycoplasma canadense]|nr:hypothetical protein [Metamycoplasma canadense]